MAAEHAAKSDKPFKEETGSPRGVDRRRAGRHIDVAADLKRKFKARVPQPLPARSTSS